MSKSLVKDLRKFFPSESIDELYSYLDERNFRLHLVDKSNAGVLNPILSERSFERRKSSGEVIESLQDLDFEIFHGNVIPGVKVKHVVDDDNISCEVKESTCLEPCYGRDNLLIAKRSLKSDLLRGYFNYEFINVYAIVS